LGACCSVCCGGEICVVRIGVRPAYHRSIAAMTGSRRMSRPLAGQVVLGLQKLEAMVGFLVHQFVIRCAPPGITMADYPVAEDTAGEAAKLKAQLVRWCSDLGVAVNGLESCRKELSELKKERVEQTEHSIRQEDAKEIAVGKVAWDIAADRVMEVPVPHVENKLSTSRRPVPRNASCWALDVPVPKVAEEVTEDAKPIVEQVVNVLVPRDVEEVMGSANAVPQYRVQHRTADQVIDKPVLQVDKEIADIVTTSPQERDQLGADVPVPKVAEDESGAAKPLAEAPLADQVMGEQQRIVEPDAVTPVPETAQKVVAVVDGSAVKQAAQQMHVPPILKVRKPVADTVVETIDDVLDAPGTEQIESPQFQTIDEEQSVGDRAAAEMVACETAAAVQERDSVALVPQDDAAAVEDVSDVALCKKFTDVVIAHAPYLSLKARRCINRSLEDIIAGGDVAHPIRYIEQYKTADRAFAARLCAIRDAAVRILHIIGSVKKDDGAGRLHAGYGPAARNAGLSEFPLDGPRAGHPGPRTLRLERVVVLRADSPRMSARDHDGDSTSLAQTPQNAEDQIDSTTDDSFDFLVHDEAGYPNARIS